MFRRLRRGPGPSSLPTEPARTVAPRQGQAPPKSAQRHVEACAAWTPPTDGSFSGPPNPRWIAQALDDAHLFGPQVDKDLGGAEPMVDLWETGDLAPSEHQLVLLQALTRKNRGYFYQPTPALVGTVHGRPAYSGTALGDDYAAILKVINRLDAADNSAPDADPA